MLLEESARGLLDPLELLLAEDEDPGRSLEPRLSGLQCFRCLEVLAGEV